VIRVRALRKHFGTRVALGGVDAEVVECQCVAIVGPSGCGKTTLLRCMNALETFEDGAIEIAGVTLGPGLTRNAARARALRETVGMVFQDLHLFPHLTALDNVALAPRIVAGRARGDAEARGRDLLARVGMADRAGAYPHELSGGQKQRVAIARALAMPVRVVLLDEPTSALDQEMREEVRGVLRALAKERSLTLVLVTHDTSLAGEIADRVWAMQEGRIVAHGSPSEVLKDRAMSG
jgi:ABC-type polar amino acid transport system ATPase subunit